MLLTFIGTRPTRRLLTNLRHLIVTYLHHSPILPLQTPYKIHVV